MTFKILGDWGTSKLKLYLVKNNVLVDTREGIGAKSAHGKLEEVLIDLCGDWLENNIESISLIGMAGSKIGIIETPYLMAPIKSDTFFNHHKEISINGVKTYISFGVSAQNFDDEHDVMRGEETQIFGALKQILNGPINFILPGTHSKWVFVNQQCIEKIHSVPTGELFETITKNSTLASECSEFNAEAFEKGIQKAINGKGFMSSIFSARSKVLLNECDAEWANSFLSGILIGYEIKEFQQHIKNCAPIYLIGNSNLNLLYSTALIKFNYSPIALNADECVLNGLLEFSKSGKH